MQIYYYKAERYKNRFLSLISKVDIQIRIAQTRIEKTTDDYHYWRLVDYIEKSTQSYQSLWASYHKLLSRGERNFDLTSPNLTDLHIVCYEKLIILTQKNVALESLKKGIKKTYSESLKVEGV